MLSENSFYQKERKQTKTIKVNFKYKIIANFRLEETSGVNLIQSSLLD